MQKNTGIFIKNEKECLVHVHIDRKIREREQFFIFAFTSNFSDFLHAHTKTVKSLTTTKKEAK